MTVVIIIFFSLNASLGVRDLGACECISCCLLILTATYECSVLVVVGRPVGLVRSSRAREQAITITSRNRHWEL